MNHYLNQHKQTITRYILLAFVFSWFGFIGQVNAHSLMILEKQQHRTMGHTMPSHCQTLVCESILSLDNQINYGLDTHSVVDLNSLPALSAFTADISQATPALSDNLNPSVVDPPPLDITGLLRI